MHSLLQLPQNVWRDNVVYFLGQVEELARLDTAVANKLDRGCFHANIDGCTRFRGCNGDCSSEKIKWLAACNMLGDLISFREEPRIADRPYIRHLLSTATWVDFSGSVLSQRSELLEWTCSKTLTDLHFQGCGIIDISALAACIHLNDLRLSNCPNVTDESFVIGITGCVDLVYCSVYHCTNLGAAAVAALLQSCVQLKSVTLNGCFDLEQVFKLFPTVSKLKSLCYDNTDEASCLTGAAIRAMATAFPLLDWLHLDFEQITVTDADLEVFVRGCIRLTAIVLSNWPLITDLGVLAIANSLTQIHSLILNYLHITDAAVRAVGSHCSTLRSFNVSFCHLLTDAALTTLNMTRLHSLIVTGTRVTGTFATHVFCPESILDRFSCYEGEHLSAAFVYCVSPSNKLTALSLGSNLLTEADWLELTTKFPHVDELIVCNSQTVTDAVATSFHVHCPKLCAVTFRDCSVTLEVIEQLRARRKRKSYHFH